MYFTMKAAQYGAILSLGMGALHVGSHSYVYAERAICKQVESVAVDVAATIAESAGYEKPTPRLDVLSAKEILERESFRYLLNPDLPIAVMRVESAENRFAVSPAGAIGLMQVMPANAKRCGLKHYGELFDDEKNIKCGVQILAEEMKTYGDNVVSALEAYNGGPKCVGGRCRESREYVQRVLKTMARHVG